MHSFGWWSPAPQEGLDSPFLWIMAGWCGPAYCPITQLQHKMVESLCLWFGEKCLTVFLACRPNSTAAYPTCLESRRRGATLMFGWPTYMKQQWNLKGFDWLPWSEPKWTPAKTLPNALGQKLMISSVVVRPPFLCFGHWGWRKELSILLNINWVGSSRFTGGPQRHSVGPENKKINHILKLIAVIVRWTAEQKGFNHAKNTVLQSLVCLWNSRGSWCVPASQSLIDHYSSIFIPAFCVLTYGSKHNVMTEIVKNSVTWEKLRGDPLHHHIWHLFWRKRKTEDMLQGLHLLAGLEKPWNPFQWAEVQGLCC